MKNSFKSLFVCLFAIALMSGCKKDDIVADAWVGSYQGTGISIAGGLSFSDSNTILDITKTSDTEISLSFMLLGSTSTLVANCDSETAITFPTQTFGLGEDFVGTGTLSADGEDLMISIQGTQQSTFTFDGKRQ